MPIMVLSCSYIAARTRSWKDVCAAHTAQNKQYSAERSVNLMGSRVQYCSENIGVGSPDGEIIPILVPVGRVAKFLQGETS